VAAALPHGALRFDEMALRSLQEVARPAQPLHHALKRSAAAPLSARAKGLHRSLIAGRKPA